ncbi:VPS9 domain protein [Drechmeria coniospora]|uniref:VPS9 domain protein n=1 Tax=Drechmeria coniospora TaxID=98403 RepID=A0A151GSH8_DRECN|nr:VPS9 domain protein [Drechmeria coniospora]KYK60059.1 VPS9 domain protein [Drechmeria coniospora]ODA80001.1 hypothetical protein RJ55_02959 [Drechmeria coniospora]
MIVYPPSHRYAATPSAKGTLPARQSAARTPSSRPPRVRLMSAKQAQVVPDGPVVADGNANEGVENHPPDAFETTEAADGDDGLDVARSSIELDDLPIELITLTDSFIESLGAKVHPTPPNIDRLSDLFQEFYALAASHIGTHLSALASRHSRNASPATSNNSISSAANRLRFKAPSLGTKEKQKVGTEHQMITADELASRKRARRALEGKRSLLEEAVERRLSEGIYDRIYRHRSTQDEAQDAKLRSKTAALALVGIGPADLGIDFGDDSPQGPDALAERSKEVGEWLRAARTDMIRMSESRYPLGKLNHLKAAHKSIVDTLAHFHPSASADEIMPMLIFTLITLPPENLHIISDLYFIQRFRWEPKLTGEAAYCLTNLEAAVSFLETVDLATLREDEHPSGPPKNVNHSGAAKAETFPPAYPQGLITPTQSAPDVATENATATDLAPSPNNHQAETALRKRRLSDLVNTPTQAFGAASGAVFSTADHGLKTISSSLGDSYSFLLGKLRERQQGPKESIVAPRTLDDARKLVSTPPLEEDENASGASSAIGAEDAEQLKAALVREDRVLSMIGGRRDASVDSSKSGRSVSLPKRGAASEERKSPAPSQSPAVLEQVRSLGSSFNPMARLSSMGMMRGFGRTGPAPTTVPKDADKPADGGDLASAFPDIATSLPPKEIPKIAPPNKRFLELQSPGELRLGEVLDLLRDYRRLAGALKNLGAFEGK